MNMHKNAKLTPLGRERMVKMMLDGHTPAKAATLAGVSPVTARKWLVRSPAGMQVVERRLEQAAEPNRRACGAARPFLKAEEVAPAHPGQDHQADYRPAASTADRQAYRPNGRRVPRHRQPGTETGRPVAPQRPRTG